MNLDELTIGEAKQLASFFQKGQKTEIKKDFGFCVVVFINGFIYIGNLSIEGEYATVTNARNLRRWSSGNGLQWHVENGSKDTVLDGKETTWSGLKANLINWAKTDKAKWN